MANKIDILNLDINTSALITKMGETRAEIERLKAAQKDLANNNQSTSESFTKNEVALKRLQTSYASQKNVVAQLSTANNAFASASAAITSAVSKENTSIESARENTKQLISLRNQLNLSSVEGQTALTNINAKLNANSDFVRENSSAYEQQKLGIGDYKTAITGALQNTGLFGGQLQGVTQSLGSFSGVFSMMKGEVKAGADQIRNSANATEGMTVAQKALSVATGLGTGAMRIFAVAVAATGIGLIIAAVALLIGYFKTFDPLVDKLEQGMAAMGAVVRVVQRTMVDFFTSITSVGDAVKKLGSFLADPIGSLKKMGDEMGKAASAAASLKEAQQDLLDQQSIQEVSNAKALQQYAELILKSKNRTLSEQERLAALKQAEAIETANYKQRETLANKDIAQAIEAARIKGGLLSKEVANLEKYGTAYAIKLLNAGKITDAEVELIKKAELAKVGIQDESTKRLEKNQNTQDKLNEDAQAKREKAASEAEAAAQKRADAAAKLIDSAIQKNKEEIDLYVAQQGVKKKSVEDELAFEEQLLAKKLALLKREFDAKKLSQTAFETQSLNLKNDFAKKQVDITIANAQSELEVYRKSLEKKKEDDKFFTDEKLTAKQTENNNLALKETEFQTLRLEQGIINESQYNDAVNLINENNRIKNEEAQKIRDEAKKEAKALDIENQRILDEEKFTNDFDLQTERENIRYAAELAAADLNGANKALIEKKHADAQLKINELKETAKRNAAAQTFGDIASLLGEETAAGKAAAIAQATINTWSGIAAVWGAQSVLPEPFGTAAKVVSTAVVLASGLQTVKKITSTKVPSHASGGTIPTLRAGLINNGANVAPLSNGDDTLAYVGQGEVILNKDQQARAGGSAFFRSLQVPGFAGGGFVGGNTNLGSQGGQKIDLDMLAAKMAQANRSLPSPVVSVHDISSTQNNVRVVEAGANF